MPTPPRRRPPTIDLKATEVVSPPAAGTGSGASADPTPGTDVPSGDPAESYDIGAEHDDAGDEAVASEGARTRRRGGVRPAVVVAAGIAGAGIAALVGALIWSAGLLPPSVGLGNSEVTAPLVARIAALEHQLQELSARPVPAAASEVQEVQARLARLESETEHQQSAIEARLEKLEVAADAPKAAPQLHDLESRVAKLEAEKATPAAAVDPALAERVSALDRRLDEAASTARQAANRAGAAEQAARASGDAESVLAKLQSGLDGVAARVDALDSAAKQTEQRLAKVATVAASNRAVGLGLAALELRIAVERGMPFADELAAARPLLPDPGLIAPLEPFAARGVPSAAILAEDLSKLAPSILKATERDRGGDVLSRLESTASRLVRIRPIDAAPGNDPEMLLARAEADAARDDIPGAVAELDRLPEDLRAPATGWIKAAQARATAIDAARRLSVSALGALTKPAP